MRSSATTRHRAGAVTTRMLLAVGLVMAAVLSTAPAVSAQEKPLEPLDTTSPRATLSSFLDQTVEVEQAALAAFENPSDATRKRAREALAAVEVLFDFSEVPDTALNERLTQSFVSLADILLRVPVPPLRNIPDETEVEDEELTFWVLPGTEITLVRLEDSIPPGAWVFSQQTVEGLPGWREQVDDQPVLFPDREITDWRSIDTDYTGRFVPSGLVDALPDVFDDVVLGTPLWKIAAAAIALVLVLVSVALWHRLVGTRGEKGTVSGYLWAMTTPIVLLVLTGMGRTYVADQVNVSGDVAQIVLFSSSSITVIGLAWLGWIVIRLIAEWVVATPVIAGERYDENLVRLSSRFVGVLAVAGILFLGADDLGIPALGLLTGLGVGGVVAGLAAQSTVENVLGGFTLFADKPFRVGDLVEFGGVRGHVEAIGQRSTRIRKLDGTLFNVPNGDIAKSTVTNFTERKESLFLHTIGVRYETTLEQLHALVPMLRERIGDHPKVLVDDQLPRVTVAEFGTSSIDIEVRAYVDTGSYHEFMLAQHDLLLIVSSVVDEVGTAIAFPSTTAYLTEDSRPRASVDH